jgi:hypothetical protein
LAEQHIPCPTALRLLLRYEPETGKLFWRPRSRAWFSDQRTFSVWNVRRAGREALTAPHCRGYRQGVVLTARVATHRVIWAIVHGSWPSKHIDHINGDRSDNRLVNLREVTSAENSKNMKLFATNTSGHSGVSLTARGKKWRARINVGGQEKHLGEFASLDEAVAARLAAERAYGFHENHGRR